MATIDLFVPLREPTLAAHLLRRIERSPSRSAILEVYLEAKRGESNLVDNIKST
jgi:hypothetical protein